MTGKPNRAQGGSTIIVRDRKEEKVLVEARSPSDSEDPKTTGLLRGAGTPGERGRAATGESS